MLSFAEQ